MCFLPIIHLDVPPEFLMNERPEKRPRFFLRPPKPLPFYFHLNEALTEDNRFFFKTTFASIPAVVIT